MSLATLHQSLKSSPFTPLIGYLWKKGINIFNISDKPEATQTPCLFLILLYPPHPK